MLQSALPFDPTLARQVKADSLVPHQQKTTARFKTSCDFRQQVMIKHPFLSDFHSRAEHLHAGLLESQSTVTSFVPQPFRVYVRRRLYTPDCYVVEDSQPRRILELKPRGEMPEDEQIVLRHFFAQYGMQFDVISNESIYERDMDGRPQKVLKIPTKNTNMVKRSLFYQD